MNIAIVTRVLTEEEIGQLVQAIASYPDLAYVKPSLIRSFGPVYVAEVDGEFAGFCAVEEYRGIRKLGPISALSKFHHAGVGKALMTKVFADSKGTRTYFGSSNPKVKAFAKTLGAVEVKSIFHLPRDIITSSVHFYPKYWSINYFAEMVRKFFKYGRGRYTFFVIE